MKKYLYPSILVLFVALAACSTTEKQTSGSSASSVTIHDFNKSLTPDLLREHLYIFASDEFEGRGTGQPGIDTAAEYITNYYREHGVKGGMPDGGFYQEFHLRGQSNTGIETQILKAENGDTSVVYRGRFSQNSFSAFYPEFGGEINATGDIIFLGYGITDERNGINHLEGVDIRDKWVMVFNDIKYVVNGDTLVSSNIAPRQRLSELLFRQGAAGMIMISHFDETAFMDDALDASTIFGMPGRLALEYTNPRGGLRATVLSVNPVQAAQLLGLTNQSLFDFYSSFTANPASFKPYQLGYSFRARAYVEDVRVPVRNIVAVVEGSDPVLKNEYVIISAHYDHTGIGAPDDSGDRIYNGADDNGSGSMAVMTMAKAMNDAKLAGHGPKRSVIFLHVTAEEIGLLGSRYYSDHPTVPVDDIIANINVDMIGRTDKENDAIGETDYVYIIGAEIISSELNNRLQKANEINGNEIKFNMRYNDLTDPNQFYRRSDHWNFGRLGIPFVFYFTGVHDDYHRPSDSPDKILYDKYAKITRQIFSTAAELANNPIRPIVDSQEFINITQSQAR